MVTERGTLAEAVRQTPVNEDAIRAGSAKLNDTRTAIALALARLHAEAAAVLTPEQRDKAKALRLDREARRDGFLQRWLSAEGGRI
jgi:Spy/CpxP family protein refolding chaperone